MIYLIDYENTANHGLEGHTTLSSDDEVIVFFNPSHKKIETDFLINSKASFRFIGISPTGHKNFMDFQIVALCAKYIYENKSVAIVSNDNGYIAVQDFFRNCVLIDNKDIKLISNLKGDPINSSANIPNTIKSKTTKNSTVEKTNEASTTKYKKSSKKKQESLEDVIMRLPISDSQKDALFNTIQKQNTKKDRLSEKKFFKKLDFLPSASRIMVIEAIMPYVKFK